MIAGQRVATTKDRRVHVNAVTGTATRCTTTATFSEPDVNATYDQHDSTLGMVTDTRQITRPRRTPVDYVMDTRTRTPGTCRSGAPLATSFGLLFGLLFVRT